MNVHWCLQEPSGRGRATLSRRHRGDRRPWKGVRKVTYNCPYRAKPLRAFAHPFTWAKATTVQNRPFLSYRQN